GVVEPVVPMLLVKDGLAHRPPGKIQVVVDVPKGIVKRFALARGFVGAHEMTRLPVAVQALADAPAEVTEMEDFGVDAPRHRIDQEGQGFLGGIGGMLFALGEFLFDASLGGRLPPESGALPNGVEDVRKLPKPIEELARGGGKQGGNPDG